MADDRIHTDAPAAEPAAGAPDPPEQQSVRDIVAAAEQQVAEANARAEAHLDQLRRLAAEFDNYKKRQARDREQLTTQANERLVRDLLPVLDDLERAVEAFEAHDADKVREGVALVHRALRTILEREGISEIDPDGQRFDPHEHE